MKHITLAVVTILFFLIGCNCPKDIIETKPNLVFNSCGGNKVELKYKYETKKIDNFQIFEAWEIFADVPSQSNIIALIFSLDETNASNNLVIDRYIFVEANDYLSKSHSIQDPTGTIAPTSGYMNDLRINFRNSGKDVIENFFAKSIPLYIKAGVIRRSLPQTTGMESIGTLWIRKEQPQSQSPLSIKVQFINGWNDKPISWQEVCPSQTINLDKLPNEKSYYIPNHKINNASIKNYIPLPSNGILKHELLLKISIDDLIHSYYNDNIDFPSDHSYNDKEEYYNLIIKELPNNLVQENWGPPPGNNNLGYSYLGNESDIYGYEPLPPLNQFPVGSFTDGCRFFLNCFPFQENTSIKFESIGFTPTPDAFYAVFLRYETSKQNMLSNYKIIKTPKSISNNDPNDNQN